MAGSKEDGEAGGGEASEEAARTDPLGAMLESFRARIEGLQELLESGRRMNHGLISLLIAAAVALPAGCGEAVDEPSTPGQETTWTEARIDVDCPGLVTADAPLNLGFNVTNLSDSDWPTTVLTYTKGSELFVIEDVTMNGKAGERNSAPEYDDNFRLGPIEAGETAEVDVSGYPSKPGQAELTWAVWGHAPSEDDRFIPSGIGLVACDVPIFP